MEVVEVPVMVVIEERVAAPGTEEPSANSIASAVDPQAAQEPMSAEPTEDSQDVSSAAPAEEVGNSSKAQEPSDGGHGSAPGNIITQCQEEIAAVQQNESMAMEAQECEKESGLSAKAIDALKEANLTRAVDKVAMLFHTCAQVSENCAKETAPSMVVKMRLAGLGRTAECEAVAAANQQAEAEPDEENMACQNGAVNDIVAALQKKYLEGALVSAQEGLHKCQNISSPCDFQLAPTVVVFVLQEGQQGQHPPQEKKQVTEVLLGMGKAKTQLKTMASKKHERVAQGRKDLSLFDLNLNMRIVSKTALATTKHTN